MLSWALRFTQAGSESSPLGAGVGGAQAGTHRAGEVFLDPNGGEVLGLQ